MKQGHSEGMNKLKQACKDTQKFDKKVIGKEFLIGKYFEAQKVLKGKKMKKFTKSKIENLLRIQEQLTQNERTFDFYLPLHQLWTSYMTDLLQNQHNQDTIYLKLLRSDFHGAYITVLHSKIDSYIGLEGIIVNQSLKTFKIMNLQNRLLTLLKHQIIFQIQVQEKYYAVHANCLIYRATDRAKVKFKSRKASKMNLRFMDNFLCSQT